MGTVATEFPPTVDVLHLPRKTAPEAGYLQDINGNAVRPPSGGVDLLHVPRERVTGRADYGHYAG